MIINHDYVPFEHDIYSYFLKDLVQRAVAGQVALVLFVYPTFSWRGEYFVEVTLQELSVYFTEQLLD